MDKNCAGCAHFQYMNGSMSNLNTIQGQCRRYAASSSGNKWATVAGDEWCSEFEANDADDAGS